MVPAVCPNRTPDINHRVAIAVVMAHRVTSNEGYRGQAVSMTWSIDDGHFSHHVLRLRLMFGISTVFYTCTIMALTMTRHTLVCM